MKSVLIAAAICAALVSVPMSAQAATTKLTDHQLYCAFAPWMKMCATATPAPAKAAAKVATAKAAPAKPAVTKVAAVKPTPAVKSASLKVYVCEKRTDGKPFLLSCSWK